MAGPIHRMDLILALEAARKDVGDLVLMTDAPARRVYDRIARLLRPLGPPEVAQAQLAGAGARAVMIASGHVLDACVPAMPRGHGETDDSYRQRILALAEPAPETAEPAEASELLRQAIVAARAAIDAAGPHDDPTCEVVHILDQALLAAPSRWVDPSDHLVRRLAALRAEKKRALQAQHGIVRCEACCRCIDTHEAEVVSLGDEGGHMCQDCWIEYREQGDRDVGP